MRVAATTVLDGARQGDSIAVDGCCLTLVAQGAGWWEADVSDETLKRTTFELGEHTWDASRMERNLLPADHARAPGELEAQWQRERPLLEFIDAQADGCYLI